MFTAGLAVQDAQVDLNQTIGNAIVNAANVISGLPLTNVKPFVAFLYPTVLLPDTTSDYDIQLLGYFPDDLGKPQFVFPDGKVVQASVGADNRLHLAIPIKFVRSYKGKRAKVVLKYRTYKRFLLPDDYSERDIWLDVLPSTVLAYHINAQALPDTVLTGLSFTETPAHRPMLARRGTEIYPGASMTSRRTSTSRTPTTRQQVQLNRP